MQLFGVKYGSIDTSIMNENGEYEAIPEGTAHFLEHKLFESEDLNAFERFAKTVPAQTPTPLLNAPPTSSKARPI